MSGERSSAPEVSFQGLARRLGKNRGGYLGETILIETVLEQIEQAAIGRGWEVECFLMSEGLRLCALRRRAQRARCRFYLSTGIHGDEPAGPLAALELIKADQWPEDIDIWLCPCLNPTGFSLNKRENATGIDLNRDYRHLKTAEIRAHVEWLQRQPSFDVSFVLHEDWEAEGFYLYELNLERVPSPAEKVIEEVGKHFPVDRSSTIDGWPAQGGIIRPNIQPNEREHWPEAIYLVSNKSKLSLTFETPSDFELSSRVMALTRAVTAGLSSISQMTRPGAE